MDIAIKLVKSDVFSILFIYCFWLVKQFAETMFNTYYILYTGTELMKHVDPNAKDFSYQHSYPEYPEVPRPLLAAAWESNNYDAVDVLMDMNPNTRMLYSNEDEKSNPPKPIFFQVF